MQQKLVCYWKNGLYLVSQGAEKQKFSVLSTEILHVTIFFDYKNILYCKKNQFVTEKNGPYLVTDSPQNVKFSVSHFWPKTAIFLFFLCKVEVFRVLVPKIEKISTVGSWVDFELKMTLKNHFQYSGSPPGGTTLNFYCGISRGYQGTHLYPNPTSLVYPSGEVWLP